MAGAGGKRKEKGRNMEPRKIPQKEEQGFLNIEELEKMRARAQLMEDELHDLSSSEYRDTGKLNSAKLSEKTQEYERYLLTIQELEKRMRKE